MPVSDRASIVEVVGEYVSLRKAGAEFIGLCPFHKEKTPSFHVNDSKGVFYCHGCHVGGDVIRFIEQIEGCDFKTAARRLGLGTYQPTPAQLQIKHNARAIALWARATSMKICDAMREIGDQIRVCKLACWQSGANQNLVQHEASLIRQWAILTDLDDDLNEPKAAIDLWQQRTDIDRLVESLG